MSELETVGYTELYLADVNFVLQSQYITAMGAYCMGVAEAIIRTTLGRMPSRHLLLLAADCTSVEEVVNLMEVWIRREQGGAQV